MRRIFVYAHDAYGMGNTRRMTAVASHLAQSFPQANVLLASGSPVIQAFRLPDRVDYIKLPSVARTDREQYATRYLTTEIAETIRLRAALLRAALADFNPDVVLVDKKPFGIMRELKPALEGLRAVRPDVHAVLILRDILDEPDRTIPTLQASGFERDVNRWFQRIAVLGSRDVFDVGHEYRWSRDTLAKLTYCGYVRTPPGARGPSRVRQEYGVAAGDRLVLVNSGGGEDGMGLLDTAVEAVAQLRARQRPGAAPTRAVVVTGPHAPAHHAARLRARAAAIGGIVVTEFTDDMASVVEAADVVVSMAGYNSVCDILSRGRRAVVVPRVHPVREQWLRATRMSVRGLFTAVHPDSLSPASLAAAIDQECGRSPAPAGACDLDGLPRLLRCVERLERRPACRGASSLPPRPRSRVPGRTPVVGAVR